MQLAKKYIRTVENKGGARRNDLRRAYNRALSGGGVREEYWKMVKRHKINKRFAKEVESEMDGQQHKDYPTTVEEMRRRWNKAKKFWNHFGGDFIERSAEEILLEAIQQARREQEQNAQRRRQPAAPRLPKRKKSAKRVPNSRKSTPKSTLTLEERIEQRRRGTKK